MVTKKLSTDIEYFMRVLELERGRVSYNISPSDKNSA